MSEFVRLRESDDPDEYRRAAAEEAPLDVWLEVVRDRPDMRFWVAQNKTVPLEILRILAEDGDAGVRSMVARKRKLDPETLSQLAGDADESVRACVARNPGTPRHVLERLRDDPWEEIRRTIEERLA